MEWVMLAYFVIALAVVNVCWWISGALSGNDSDDDNDRRPLLPPPNQDYHGAQTVRPVAYQYSGHQPLPSPSNSSQYTTPISQREWLEDQRRAHQRLYEEMQAAQRVRDEEQERSAAAERQRLWLEEQRRAYQRFYEEGQAAQRVRDEEQERSAAAERQRLRVEEQRRAYQRLYDERQAQRAQDEEREARRLEEQRREEQRIWEERQAAQRARDEQVRLEREAEVARQQELRVADARKREERLSTARRRGNEDAQRAIDEERAARDFQPPSRKKATEYNQDQYFTRLRDKAIAARQKMLMLSRSAFSARRDGRHGAIAKLELAASQKRAKMEKNDAQASAWIYARNNAYQRANIIDLHDLYVDEACYYAELALKDARSRSATVLEFIVGKGIHSHDGVAKIKPAIQQLLESNHITTAPHKLNPGRLYAYLQGGGQSSTL